MAALTDGRVSAGIGIDLSTVPVDRAARRFRIEIGWSRTPARRLATHRTRRKVATTCTTTPTIATWNFDEHIAGRLAHARRL
jgi:hypothetical protein